jgi:hypothetical protein
MTTSNGELLLSPFNVTLYGKPVEGVNLEADKFGHRIAALLQRSGKPSLRLANVYGYAYEGRFFQLPAPTVFLLSGDGESCQDDKFPEAHRPWQQHNKWTLDPTDPSIRFEIESGTLAELLLEPAQTDDAMAEEGTLIRGADGRMYYIPESLDAYEIHDEDEKSALTLAESVEHPDLRVSTTAFRGRMTFRGRMAFRGRMSFRGRMTAPNRCR